MVFIAFIFMLLLSLSPFMTLSALSFNSVNIFNPEDKPYGLSYEEHIKNFWNWVISLPQDKNPWPDQTGEKCTTGQLDSTSPVFYLSGNGGGKSDRVCKVPAGKGLFIPVSPFEISDKEAPNRTVEDLHKIARKDQDSVTTLYLKIDDKEYKKEDLDKYRIHTEDFEVVFPKNGLFGASEGASKAVADGYYVITHPLEKGNYTITYTSALKNPEAKSTEPTFDQDITYKLIVE